MKVGKKSWEGKRVGDPVGRDIRLKEILLENRAAFGFHSKLRRHFRVSVFTTPDF